MREGKVDVNNSGYLNSTTAGTCFETERTLLIQVSHRLARRHICHRFVYVMTFMKQ